jgi:signal transduction histidine kinase
MKKVKLKNTLLWRLSAAFLILLLLLGLAYVVITTISANRYFQETTQRLNADVASEMLLEVQPFVDGEVNKKALDKLMHSMMAVNPRLEVYLLDPNGEILSYVVLKKKVKLSRVSLEPIRKFINSNGEKYVLGDDPRNPGQKTIFSATEVRENGILQGYVYMVLVSEKFENIASTMLGSYWLRVSTRSFIITLIAAFLIGLGLIYYLTRNLRVVINTVKKFEQGDLHARIPEKNTKGEMALLSRTFNHMADTILHNIDELKKVDTLRRELIANVSHDLRNPLAVMHGYIETLWLKDDKVSPEERKQYYRIIMDSSDKLKRLVSDLFELSKLETGQLRPNREPFLINELLQDASQKYNMLADKKNVELYTNIDRELPMVYADISLIDRVIQNLVDNAIKYTPEKGWIKLVVHQENGNVQIDVENSGEGIPEKDIDSIFNRYYKVDKEKSGIEGTGLGLAIVKKILDLHQAPIKVQSQPNQFTRFRFSLPVYESA